MRKNEGYSSFLAFLIVCVFALGLVALTVDFSGDQVKSGKIVDVMRKYVLIMEGNGCLTSAEQEALILELEHIGVSNITFNSNPQIKVAYGEEVVLSITGEIDALKFSAFEDFKIVRTENGFQFSKTLKSTAQY